MPHRKAWRGMVKIVAVGFALAACPMVLGQEAPALPQFDVQSMPPIESQSSQPSPILTYLVGVVLSLIAVGLAVMPSRREHRD